MFLTKTSAGEDVETALESEPTVFTFLYEAISSPRMHSTSSSPMLPPKLVHSSSVPVLTVTSRTPSSESLTGGMGLPGCTRIGSINGNENDTSYLNSVISTKPRKSPILMYSDIVIKISIPNSNHSSGELPDASNSKGRNRPPLVSG